MAQLPLEHLIQDRIGDMMVGDTGYTTPWSMAVDENWECWINLDGTTTADPGGTSSLPVARTAAGWAVGPLSSDHKWRVKSSMPQGDWTPVHSIVTANEIASR